MHSEARTNANSSPSSEVSLTVAVEIDETIGTRSKMEKTTGLVNLLSSKCVMTMQSSRRERMLSAEVGSKPNANVCPCASASHAPATVAAPVTKTVVQSTFWKGIGGGGGAGGGG